AQRENLQAVAATDPARDLLPYLLERRPGLEEEMDATHRPLPPALDQKPPAHDHTAAVPDVVGDDAHDREVEFAGRGRQPYAITEVQVETVRERRRHEEAGPGAECARGLVRVPLAVPVGRVPHGIER